MKDEDVQWQTQSDRRIADTRLFFFSDVLLICKEISKNVLQIVCPPIRIHGVVLSPQVDYSYFLIRVIEQK